MKLQTNSKIILPLIFAILLLQMVSADIVINKLTCDFSVSSTSIDRKACACSTLEIPVTVDNVGDVEALFNVEVISDQEDWFIVRANAFNLKPGESRTSLITAEIPCGFSGNVDYTVKVTTREFGREREIHRSFEVVECNNIYIEEKTNRQFSCPAESSTFTFKVSNPAPFSDTYNIKLRESADYSDFVTLSESQFTLSPGEEKEIFAYARFPASVWGEFTLPLTVSSERNKMSQDIQLSLEIKRAYDVSVTLEESAVFVCNELGHTMQFTVKNNEVDCNDHNGVENTYNIKLLDAPGYAQLNTQRVKLSPGEEETLSITIPRTEDLAKDVGNYDVTLLVESELGSMRVERTIALEVADCYNHFVDIDAPSTCIICGQDTDLDVNVRNTGIFEEDIRLSMLSEDWMDLVDTLVTVAPAETKAATLEVNAPCADQNYELNVNSVNTEINHVTASASAVLQVCTPRTAYMIELPKHNFNVRPDTEFIEVPVRHRGFYPGTYRINLNSTMLEPETGNIHSSPGEKKYMKFSIVGDFTELDVGEYLHGLALTEVSMNLVYDTTIGTNYLGPTLLSRITSWLMNTLVHSKWYSKPGLCGWSGILLLAVLIAVAVVNVLMRGKIIKVKRFRAAYRTHFKVIRGALLIIAVLGILFSALSFSLDKPGFFEDPVEGGPLMHQWMQGTDYFIDLNRYFADPDNDRLTYDYRGADHIQVAVTNGVAVLSPDSGWSGQEQIVFAANDPAGASVSSKNMTLRVLGKKDVSWLDYWLGNCSEVNAFLIALIFLGIVLICNTCRPYSVEEARQRREAAAKLTAAKAAARKKAAKPKRRRR